MTTLYICCYFSADKDVVIKDLTFSVLFTLAMLYSSAAQSVDLITHDSVKVKALTVAEVRRIYTMRQKLWSDALPIVVFVLPSTNELHQEFAKQTLKIFPYQLDRIWNKLTFSGIGTAPIMVKTQQALIEAVSKTPGAIGYADTMREVQPVHIIEIKE